jgi:hypothetical protein
MRHNSTSEILQDYIFQFVSELYHNTIVRSTQLQLDRVIHNQIWACSRCNSLKGTKGLYEFYREKYPGESKFYDLIPPLLEKKYLKTIINCHECAKTLSMGDLVRDGQITVLDIDFILHQN